jgi:Putative zinc-finger
MELGVLDKPSFEESLRELAARRLAAEGHPSPENLAAYRAGELSKERHEQIKDHLAICEDCSRLFLDLADFERFEPARESLSPADAQAEASWQRLRERLHEEPAALEREEDARADERVPVLSAFPSRRRIPVWRRPALPWALAAGLTLCVVGLGLRMGSLEQAVGELSRPRTGPVVTLLPEDDATRGESGTELPFHAEESVTYDLLLSSDPKAPTFSLYEVEIVQADGGGRPISAGRDAGSQGMLRISWPSPEPGDYVCQVFGIEGDKKIPVGRYHFTVLPAR